MKKIFLFVCIAVLFSVGSVYACPKGMTGKKCDLRHGAWGAKKCDGNHFKHKCGSVHKHVKKLLKNKAELELSEEQVNTLEEIETGITKDCIRLNADVKLARVDLKNLTKGSQADMDKARAKVTEIHNLNAKLEISHMEGLDKAKKVLTPEQKEKFKKLCSGEKKKECDKKTCPL